MLMEKGREGRYGAAAREREGRTERGKDNGGPLELLRAVVPASKPESGSWFSAMLGKTGKHMRKEKEQVAALCSDA
jgi:hypothetical protein